MHGCRTSEICLVGASKPPTSALQPTGGNRGVVDKQYVRFAVPLQNAVRISRRLRFTVGQPSDHRVRRSAGSRAPWNGATQARSRSERVV